MSKMQRFDVFGKTMAIAETTEGWMLHRVSANGTRAPVNDVVITADLKPTDFERFLDDIYHELASERHFR